MPDTLYPPDWDHDSDLHARLVAEMIVAAARRGYLEGESVQ